MHISSELDTAQNLSLLIPEFFQVYLTEEPIPNASLWYFFRKLDTSWELMILVSSAKECDWDLLNLSQKIAGQSRYGLIPARVSVLHLHATQLTSPVQSQAFIGGVPCLRINWIWDSSQIHTILSGKLSQTVRLHWPETRLRIAHMVFLVLTLTYMWQSSSAIPDIILRYGVNLYNFVPEQPWGVFTGILLQGSFLHFLLNSATLYLISSLIERFLHPLQMILALLLSGYCGALVSLAANGTQVNSVGASGAIYGLLGLALQKYSQPLLPYGPFYEYHGKRILSVLWLMLLFTLVGPLLLTRVDSWGHCGGLVCGYVLGYLFYSRSAKVIRMAILGLFSIAISLLHHEVSLQATELQRMLSIRDSEQKILLDVINREYAPLIGRIEKDLVSPQQFNISDFPVLESWTPELPADRLAYDRFLGGVRSGWELRSLPAAQRATMIEPWREQMLLAEQDLIARYGLKRASP